MPRSRSRQRDVHPIETATARDSGTFTVTGALQPEVLLVQEWRRSAQAALASERKGDIMQLRCAVVFLLFASAGCGSRASAPLPDTHSQGGLRAAFSTGTGKITHMVFVVQENRSFDNLFQGYPGADTVSQGMNSEGQAIQLQPVPLSTTIRNLRTTHRHVRRVQRNREPPGNGLPDERLQ